MSQTRTIRELKSMIAKRKRMFEGEYASPKDSPAGRNIQEQIDTLEMALLYVEQSYRPTEALKEKLQQKLDEVMGKQFFGNRYEEDKNSGWEEALEWMLEVLE